MSKPLYERPSLVRHQMGMMNKFGRVQGAKPLTHIDGVAVADLVAQHGSPLFVFSQSTLIKRYRELYQAFARRYAKVRIAWSYKTNYLEAICRIFHREGAYAEVVSQFEFDKAVLTGVSPDRIHFNGPSKPDDAIEAALRGRALLHIDNFDELARIERIAERLGVRPRVALRINPPFELAPAAARMGGGPRKFGVDSEQAPQALAAIAALPLEFVGFHCYAGSQCLDADAIIATQRMTLDLMAELARLAPAPVRLLNFGGGFGIPQHAGESPLDLARIGSAMAALARDAATCLPQAALTLELGRYLVGEAGLYVCRVIERKVSRGRTFLVLDGGLHHHWHATGALEGRRHLHFPLALANRLDAAPTETVTVAGPLCAPHDIFAHDVPLARAEPGDLIAVFQSGAYGPSASPGGFLGRPGAVEMLV